MPAIVADDPLCCVALGTGMRVYACDRSSTLDRAHRESRGRCATVVFGAVPSFFRRTRATGSDAIRTSRSDRTHLRPRAARTRPLTLYFAAVEELLEYAVRRPRARSRQRFLPGPLILLFASRRSSATIFAGLETVACACRTTLWRAFSTQCGPLAATTANLTAARDPRRRRLLDPPPADLLIDADRRATASTSTSI